MEENTETNNPTASLEQSPVEQNPSIPEGVQADVAPEDSKSKGKIARMDVVRSVINAFSSDDATDEAKIECYQTIKTYLRQLAAEHLCCDAYNILVLYDHNSLVKGDADRIYQAVTKFQDKKPLLLVLYSSGGYAGSAYLIGKLCIESSDGKFVIAVPRMAKSAATLLCCAANEIHMGSLSELGPLDPQINDLPALGLKNSIEHIAELIKKHPASSEMFAQYLHKSLPLIHLGYYERVAESAIQYAERLLSTHEDVLKKRPDVIANELVYKYKDHGFVIDKSEAEAIFGEEIIKSNTEEYELGNTLYGALAFIHRIAEMFEHSFYFIGSFDSDPVFTKRN